MGQYSKKGLYSGYDKNHKEREALDYYATPTKEVENILEITQLDLNKKVILEPCCGGGHMVEGILKYEPNLKVIATDIKERENEFLNSHKQLGVEYHWGEDCDFLNDNYNDKISKDIDYVIMNPPFSLLVPFTCHAIEIANKGVLMLGKLQFLETQNRYNEIFKTMPPTDIYGYIDRISCFKNGDFTLNPNSIEAYAWYFWDKEKLGQSNTSTFHWIWSKKRENNI